MANNQFADKVIAITGAASGMGLTTAKLLASRGATLSLADIAKEGLEKVKQEIESEYKSKVLIYALDVRKYDQVEGWIAETVKEFGRLDGAANMAGVVPKTIAGDAGMVENQDPAEWDFIFDVNTKGLMHCMKAQLLQMKSDASIVNAASIAGLMGRDRNGSYAASKHAVIGLTRSAAKEVGIRGVRVNCICPGRINTPMLAAASTAENAVANGVAVQKGTLDDIALRRVGQPEEVSKLIAFLLSDESSYMTGTAISIDGGWAC